MSHFSMFVPTKANMKLSTYNKVHAQGIGVVLCHFTNHHIIYSLVPVYYCPDHAKNKILLGAIKCYVGFKTIISEPLEHCDCVDPKGRSWRSPTGPRKNGLSSNKKDQSHP